MGLEPTTFTLARREPAVTSAGTAALADDTQRDCTPDCTPDCTRNARTGNRGHPSDGDGGFAAALAMIATLPLSEAEKAEAVRRLLTQIIPR